MFDLKLVLFLGSIGFLHAAPKHGDAVRNQVFRESIEDPRKLLSVTVVGNCITNTQSFSNNLLAGGWADGVPFHFAVRHDHGEDGNPKIFLQSRDEEWQEGGEKYYYHGDAFNAGNKFTLK